MIQAAPQANRVVFLCVSVLDSRGLFFLFSSHHTGVKPHWLRYLHFILSVCSYSVYTRMNVLQTTVGTGNLGRFFIYFRTATSLSHNVRPHLDVLVYISKTMASVHSSWLAARAFCHLLFLCSACTAALASTLSQTSVPFCASTLSSVNNLHLGLSGLQETHFQHERFLNVPGF